MKNSKQKKRSQLLIIGILIISLMGVLIINSDRATAENGTSAVTALKKADAENTDDTALAEYSSSIFPSMLKLLSALALVIACIYAALFLFKKMMGKKYSGNRQTKIMEVLETTYVGPKKSVSLIRVADKSVLIGTTDSQISILSELDEEKTREIIRSLENEVERDLCQVQDPLIGEYSLL